MVREAKKDIFIAVPLSGGGVKGLPFRKKITFFVLFENTERFQTFGERKKQVINFKLNNFKKSEDLDADCIKIIEKVLIDLEFVS